MERYIMNYDGLSATVNSIGCILGETFIVDEDGHDALQEIWQLLESEDKATLPIRRQLAVLEFGPKVLIPLLRHVYDEDNEDVENREAIFYLALKLLVFLTEPLSAVMDQNPSFARQMKSGDNTAIHREMNLLSTDIYSQFLKPQIHKSLFCSVMDQFSPNGDVEVTEDNTGLVNCVLYLYRNLLSHNDPHQHRVNLIRLMFAAGVDDFFHFVFTFSQKCIWSVALAQLLPLLYQDQCDLFKPLFEVDCEQKMLTTSDESSTVCIEDMSSQSCGYTNTCGTDQSMATNEAVNIMSEPMKSMARAIQRMHVRDSSEGSSSGSSSNNMTATSDSEESPKHFFEELEEKLDQDLIVLFVRKNLQLLAEMFVNEGLVDLLYSLKAHYLGGNPSGLSFLYYTWILQYFLKFASGNRTGLSNIRELISVDVVGVLIYHLCMLQEAMLCCHTRLPQAVSREFQMCLRSLHEIIDYVLKESDAIPKQDQSYIAAIKPHFAAMTDLREMFPYLIRHFDREALSLDILSDIITLNHKVLLMIETCDGENIDMYAHIQNFASGDMMMRMMSCLEDFASCGEDLIDAVFTMMHHVVSNLGQLDAVMQWPILQQICHLDEDVAMRKLKAEHLDILNYVLRQFFKSHNQVILTFPQDEAVADISSAEALELTKLVCGTTGPLHKTLKPAIFTTENEAMQIEEKEEDEQQKDAEDDKGPMLEEWTSSEIDLLFKVNCQDEGGVESVLKALKLAGLKKTTFQVLMKMLTMELLSEEKFREVVSGEPDLMSDLEIYLKKEQKDNDNEEKVSTVPICMDEAIQRVQEECTEPQVQWLQRQMMEACYVHLGGRELNKPYAEAPVYLHMTVQNKPLPLITYTLDQEQALAHSSVQDLLLHMDCVMPVPGSTFYPRFSPSWKAFDYYVTMRKLGPIEHLEPLKVSQSDFKDQVTTKQHLTEIYPIPEEKSDDIDDIQNIPQALWPQVIKMFNQSLKVQ